MAHPLPHRALANTRHFTSPLDSTILVDDHVCSIQPGCPTASSPSLCNSVICTLLRVIISLTIQLQNWLWHYVPKPSQAPCSCVLGNGDNGPEKDLPGVPGKVSNAADADPQIFIACGARCRPMGDL